MQVICAAQVCKLYLSLSSLRSKIWGWRVSVPGEKERKEKGKERERKDRERKERKGKRKKRREDKKISAPLCPLGHAPYPQAKFSARNTS